MEQSAWAVLEQQFDPRSFGNLLTSFPSHLASAVHSVRDLKPGPLSVRNVVICGMGGSGIAGQLVRDWFSARLSVPLVLHSGYGLPSFVTEDSLVILVSYSGNTEEVLSGFAEARLRNARVKSIASGGQLADLDPDCRLVPENLPPRQSLAFLLVGVLAALHETGVLLFPFEALRSAAERLQTEQGLIREKAQQLALRSKNRLVLVYSSPLLAAVGYRWQTQLNENAKQLCHAHVVPEMNHNEINALPDTQNIFAVLLHEDPLSVQLSKRFSFMKQVLGPENCSEEAILSESSIEAALMALHMGDWFSYFVALQNQKDPFAIPLIESLKKALQ